MSETATHPVKDGAQSIPFFELPDENGNTFDLAGKLSEGPMVLLFYRGDW